MVQILCLRPTCSASMDQLLYTLAQNPRANVSLLAENLIKQGPLMVANIDVERVRRTYLGSLGITLPPPPAPPSPVAKEPVMVEQSGEAACGAMATVQCAGWCQGGESCLHCIGVVGGGGAGVQDAFFIMSFPLSALCALHGCI